MVGRLLDFIQEKYVLFFIMMIIQFFGIPLIIHFEKRNRKIINLRQTFFAEYIFVRIHYFHISTESYLFHSNSIQNLCFCSLVIVLSSAEIFKQNFELPKNSVFRQAFFI